MNRIKSKSVDLEKSPFERLDENPNVYEIVKMIFGFFVLVPLRIWSCGIIIVLFYVFSMLMVFMCEKCNFSRRVLNLYTRLMARSILFICGFHYIREMGDKTRNKGVHVLMSNHISFWEILYFMAAKQSPSFVFKKDCLQVPFVGTIALKVLQGIQVDNKNNNRGGAEAIIHRLKQMEDAKDEFEFRPLLIFPEGTTSNGSCLLKFRSGGFITGTPIKPVVISFPFKRFSVAYESIYTSVIIFRTLCQFHNSMHVQYLDAYYPNEIEKMDPPCYANGLRKRMSIALKVPVCDASYSDKRKYHQFFGAFLKASKFGWVTNFWKVKPKHRDNELILPAVEYRYANGEDMDDIVPDRTIDALPNASSPTTQDASSDVAGDTIQLDMVDISTEDVMLLGGARSSKVAGDTTCDTTKIDIAEIPKDACATALTGNTESSTTNNDTTEVYNVRNESSNASLNLGKLQDEYILDISNSSSKIVQDENGSESVNSTISDLKDQEMEKLEEHPYTVCTTSKNSTEINHTGANLKNINITV